MFSGNRLNYEDAKRALKRGNTLEVWFEGKNYVEADMLIRKSKTGNLETISLDPSSSDGWTEISKSDLREAAQHHKLTRRY